jgi:Mn-dependent DtxR family transcriptional regulator
MKNQESMENYLETIYTLSIKIGNVKSIDVVHELGFSKPSVSVAVKNMKAKGYITVDESGYIKLTDEGRAIATSVYERHTVITQLLEQLGVSKEVAAEDACKMEHVISEESFVAMKNHMEMYGKK